MNQARIIGYATSVVKHESLVGQKMLIAVPFILLWVLVYYWQTGIFGNELTSASTKGLVASAVGIFFGLIICFGFYFCEMHRVNQSVREIDELAKD